MAIKVNGINVINDGRKGEFRSVNPGRYSEVERDNLNPAVGDMIFNTTEGEVQVWDGSEWVSGASGGTGIDPAITSATLTEDSPGEPRFTDSTFTTTVEMFQEGVPVSTKGIKAKVIAEFPIYPDTNVIDSVTENTTLVDEGDISANGNTNINTQSNSGTPFFNFVDPTTQKLTAYFLQNNNSGEQTTVHVGSTDLSTFSTVGSSTSIGSPYAGGSSAAYITPDEKYVNIFNINQGQGIYARREDFLAGDYSKIQYNYELEFKGYRFRIGSGGSFGTTVSRYQLNENGAWITEGSSKTIPGDSSWVYCQATIVGDYLVITSKESSTRMLFSVIDQAYLDNWDSESTTLSHVDKTINDGDALQRTQVAHKGKLLSASKYGIISFNPVDDSFSSASIPSTPPTGNSDFIRQASIWEDPYGDLILRTAWATTPGGTNTNFAYYKSNNSGATWVPDPMYPTIASTGSDPNCVYLQTDIYQYGYRVAGTINGDNDQYARRYSHGYHDVTVTDGADLSDFNVGDVVQPGNTTNPRQFMLVDNITSNGDGTTTLRLRGFYSPSVGEKLYAAVPTGSELTSKWLVIQESTGLVSDMTSVEPDYVAIGPSTTVPITFVSTFPTGLTPDEELVEGTAIQTFIKAFNGLGESEATSNVLTPDPVTPVDPPPVRVLKLIESPANNYSRNPFNLYNDNGELITATDATTNDVVTNLDWWINKQMPSTSTPRGFRSTHNGTSSVEPEGTLKFSVTNAQNMRLVIGGAAAMDSAPNPAASWSTLDVVSRTTGVTNANNASVSQSGALGQATREFVFSIGADVAEIEIQLQSTCGGNDAVIADNAITYWRLEDQAGNDVGTYE